MSDSRLRRSVVDLVCDEVATLRAAGHRKLTHNARGLARGHYRVAKDIYPKLAEISEREWIELLEDEMAEVQP